MKLSSVVKYISVSNYAQVVFNEIHYKLSARVHIFAILLSFADIAEMTPCYSLLLCFASQVTKLIEGMNIQLQNKCVFLPQVSP